MPLLVATVHCTLKYVYMLRRAVAAPIRPHFLSAAHSSPASIPTPQPVISLPIVVSTVHVGRLLCDRWVGAGEAGALSFVVDANDVCVMVDGIRLALFSEISEISGCTVLFEHCRQRVRIVPG